MNGRLTVALLICLLGARGAIAHGAAGAFGQAPASRSPTQQQVHPAVVRIVAPGNGSISYGSGTLVFSDGQYGLVMTNWHVINEATGPISVHFPTASIRSARCKRPIATGTWQSWPSAGPTSSRCAWPTRPPARAKH